VFGWLLRFQNMAFPDRVEFLALTEPKENHPHTAMPATAEDEENAAIIFGTKRA
jgi:hypothetical protein